MSDAVQAKMSRIDQITGNVWAQVMVSHLTNGRYVCVMCMSPVFRYSSQGEVLMERVSLLPLGDGSIMFDGAIASADRVEREVLVTDDKELANLITKYRDIQAGVYIKESWWPWSMPQKMIRCGVYPRRHTNPATLIISPPYALVVHHNIGKERMQP